MTENEFPAGAEVVVWHDLPDDRVVPLSAEHLSEVLRHQSSAWLRRFAEDNAEVAPRWAERARQIHDERVGIETSDDDAAGVVVGLVAALLREDDRAGDLLLDGVNPYAVIGTLTGMATSALIDRYGSGEELLARISRWQPGMQLDDCGE